MGRKAQAAKKDQAQRANLEKTVTPHQKRELLRAQQLLMTKLAASLIRPKAVPQLAKAATDKILPTNRLKMERRKKRDPGRAEQRLAMARKGNLQPGSKKPRKLDLVRTPSL